MESHDELKKELAQFSREQRAINAGFEATHKELMENVKWMQESAREQNEKHDEIHKELASLIKSQHRMFKEHESWMRNHSKILDVHWREIQKTKDKGS